MPSWLLKVDEAAEKLKQERVAAYQAKLATSECLLYQTTHTQSHRHSWILVNVLLSVCSILRTVNKFPKIGCWVITPKLERYIFWGFFLGWNFAIIGLYGASNLVFLMGCAWVESIPSKLFLDYWNFVYKAPKATYKNCWKTSECSCEEKRREEKLLPKCTCCSI